MKNNFELEYKQLLTNCLLENKLCGNRTNVKTYKLFNKSINIDLADGFPIITGKKIDFDKGLHEFLWIYNGKTDLKYLNENNIKWWDDFAINGKLGKVYGYQVRKYNGNFDQIDYCINEIKNNSRRAIITLWNPSDLDEQALPCCYTQFNFVRINDELNMAMDFRSSDLFLGLPYDIIVGALFLIAIAKECGLKPKMLGINLKDAHIYENHYNQVEKYLNLPIYNLPKIKINKGEYEIENYNCGPFIKAELVK